MTTTLRIAGALKALIWVMGAAFWVSGAWAHKASDAYLRVTNSPNAEPGHEVTLQLSLALKDADAALEALDADGDRHLTWGEIRLATPAVAQWVGEGLQWTCGHAVIQPHWHHEALEQRIDGRYIRLGAVLECGPPQTLALDYRLMRGIDPTHRLLVSGQLGTQPLAAVLAPEGRSSTTLRPEHPAGGVTTLIHFISEGVHHILEGYDHLAFLLALLLPISLSRRPDSQTATKVDHRAPDRWNGIQALMLTVTSFTVGHSITLALAGLGWIAVSATWVEPAIALSIGTSALLNLYPVRGLNTRMLALGFGLIHGLGFSGALMEAGVSDGLLVWALAGFNLGVEVGQLLVGTLWCVASVVLSRWSNYRLVVVKGGSMALFMLSLYWTFQRVALT